MIAYTSRLSLKGELEMLAGKRLIVYLALLGAPAPGLCIAEIAALVGRKECSVCARVHELRALGCIENGPLKVAPITEKMVMTYRAIVWRPEAPEPRQPELPKGEPREPIFGAEPAHHTALLVKCATETNL